MKEKELSDKLADLLEQLHAGVPIEQILKERPAQVAELGALLQAADQLRQPTKNLPDITEAQSRSRALFLSESALLSSKARRKRVRLSLPFRLTGSIVLVTGFLLAITGLASASSLPGEQLYPLKLAIEQAQIGLTSDPAARLQMQQTFDQQRSSEVSALIQQGRNQQVTFYGFVAVPKKGTVVIGGLPVTLPPEQVKSISNLAGSYVSVTGKTSAKSVVVIGKIHLQTVQLDGAIQSMQADNWRVDNLNITINSATEIQGKPKTGQHVYINATRLPDGKLAAVSINLDQPDANKEDNELLTIPNETPEPHQTQRPQSTKPGPTSSPTPSPTYTPTPSPTQKNSATPTRQALPTSTSVSRIRMTATAEITPTPTRTIQPTKTVQASPTPTFTVKPVPDKQTRPTATQVDRATPTIEVTPTAALHKSQTPPGITTDKPQEEEHEPAGSPDTDQIIPTPTPNSAGKGRNNTLAPTPDQNTGPLIQSSDPNSSDPLSIQPSPSPVDNCLATPQDPDSLNQPGLPPNTQIISPDCTLSN
ncbi:MAG: DUF5667 domain-containing protein [Anaerolineaceae bacterium]|nr:DUF5667 domain-containing protein [Anaerolineaceae bacterium]